MILYDGALSASIPKKRQMREGKADKDSIVEYIKERGKIGLAAYAPVRYDFRMKGC